MPIEYEAAVDEMFALYKTAWDAETTPIVGYIPETRWPGLEIPGPVPDKSKYWVRMNQITVQEPQVAFCVSPEKLYESSGLIIAQLFCPKSSNLGYTNGRKLSMIIKKAYRGKKTSGGVWFQNVRVQEMEPEENFYRFNVIAEYQYNDKG